MSILTQLLVMTEKITIGEGAIYALIGFVFVFLGIGVLIGILYLVGAIMQKTKGDPVGAWKGLFKKKKQTKEEIVEELAVTENEEEISDEVKVAIMAAIMAYYSQAKPQCEFKVKKIKRI